jgi:hypothetical protein
MNMLKSAKKEILLIFPTTNSFIRQDKIGSIQLAKNALKERDVKVRILMPIDKISLENQAPIILII